MPARFGEEDPSCAWAGEPTLVCASARARAEPTLPAAALGWRELSEPARRTAAGEAGRGAPYGEPARCTGSVLHEYGCEGRDRCSPTPGEPNPLPRDVRSDPRDGDMLVPTVYEGDCALDGTELTRLITRLAAVLAEGCWKSKTFMSFII